MVMKIRLAAELLKMSMTRWALGSKNCVCSVTVWSIGYPSTFDRKGGHVPISTLKKAGHAEIYSIFNNF